MNLYAERVAALNMYENRKNVTLKELMPAFWGKNCYYDNKTL